MPREQNGYKEETDGEFLSEALTLLRKITDEAIEFGKKFSLEQNKGNTDESSGKCKKVMLNPMDRQKD